MAAMAWASGWRGCHCVGWMADTPKDHSCEIPAHLDVAYLKWDSNGQCHDVVSLPPQFREARREPPIGYGAPRSATQEVRVGPIGYGASSSATQEVRTQEVGVRITKHCQAFDVYSGSPAAAEGPSTSTQSSPSWKESCWRQGSGGSTLGDWVRMRRFQNLVEATRGSQEERPREARKQSGSRTRKTRKRKGSSSSRKRKRSSSSRKRKRGKRSSSSTSSTPSVRVARPRCKTKRRKRSSSSSRGIPSRRVRSSSSIRGIPSRRVRERYVQSSNRNPKRRPSSSSSRNHEEM